MTKLRIAQVCADAGIAPGSTKGAALHLRGLAAGLLGREHEVTTFSTRTPEGPHPVPVRDLATFSPSTARDFDIVYERYSLGHTRARDIAHDSNLRFVLEVNAPLVDEALQHRPHTVGPNDEAIEADLLQRADLVVSVSSELTEWIRTRRSGPTITVPNGFEPAWFETHENRDRPREPRFPLVFLGHPKPWHGADRIVEILGRLAARDLHPRTLVVGGGEGATELVRAASAAGGGSLVHCTGPVAPNEVAKWLAQCGVGIAPYHRQDPFYFCPLKVVDYMAAGLPIVATAQGDIPDLVGDAGLLVDPDDTDGLADAVLRLLTDRALRRRMGESGRTRAHQTLTWKHAAARTVEAILQLPVPAAVQ